MATILTEREAQALCNRALRHITADSAQVDVLSRVGANTRFAVNEVSSGGDVTDVVVTLSAQVGRQSASVTLNQRDDRALAEAGRKLEALVQLAPEDPELMSLLEPQTYVSVDAFFERSAELSAVARAEAVGTIIGQAREAGLIAAGFLAHDTTARAVANSAGLFAYHRSTVASLSTTVRTADGTGSGWAGTTHNDWDRIATPAALAARAIQKAEGSAAAMPVEPGKFTVVLEPTAVASLVTRMPAALDARAADEGRSPFARAGGGTTVGEQIADSRVTLRSDPSHPDILEQPFTDEGLALSPTVWVERGILRNLGYDRYWAAQRGRAPLPVGGGLVMEGGSASVDELVSSVERGLLVTRFWYIRPVNPRTLTYTGLTRDGTFLIENGRVTRAVKNLRFNESVLGMLSRVEALGTVERAIASESGGLGPAVVVPPLVIRDFTFTAVSDAV
ncbi:MAG: TldD/PmbA family protein [Gemmatimonadota bacterium]|nr:TldD/PmbA family protein [Gemmatimonadota bacterium]